MSKAGIPRRIERLWYGGSPLALLLQPLAWLFAMGVSLRRLLYRRGWLRSQHPGIPVIVVGNITVGGTGKTPMVDWLVQRLRAAGLRPAIVSRGYGGAWQRDPVRVTAASRAEEVGDEPLLLARRTGVSVAVAARRARAALLVAAEGADVVVADDGLQHYALARDLEIIVIDGERQLGNGRLLPAGPLREPASRLGTADLVLVNGGQSSYGRIAFTLRLRGAVALNSPERRDLAFFAGKKVWAVAGIGNPQRFFAELRSHGIDATPVDLPDHGRADLGRLRRDADWPILMTEKDAVKYPQCPDPDAWYLPAEVEMSPESEAAIMSRVHDALRGHARTAAKRSRHD